MSAKGYYDSDDLTENFVTAAVLLCGDVVQCPSGRAGLVVGSGVPIAIGDTIAAQVSGTIDVAKTVGIAFLPGGRVYWDVSASKATFRKVNDKDFYIGVAVKDALMADTEVKVALNATQVRDICVHRDAFLSVPTGTQALGAFGFPKTFGGAIRFDITATNEAQCNDLFSVDRWAVGANAIAEAIFRLDANGSTSAVDISFGIASATSTTDADAIAEHVLVHIDGGALDVFAQSKDGSTTVAAVDTTVNATAGSAVANRVEVWIDTRDMSSVKVYINGVLVLDGTTGAATTLNMGAAAGPLGLLAHVEKSSSTATATVTVEELNARYAIQ